LVSPAAIARSRHEVEDEGVQKGTDTGDPSADSIETVDEERACNGDRQEESEILEPTDDMKPAIVRIFLPVYLLSMTKVNAENESKQTKNGKYAMNSSDIIHAASPFVFSV